MISAGTSFSALTIEFVLQTHCGVALSFLGKVFIRCRLRHENETSSVILLLIVKSCHPLDLRNGWKKIIGE